MTREYSPEVKAQVMAALLAGQSVSSVAKEHDIPKGTVSGWRKQAESIVSVSLGVATVATQKEGRIGELLIDLLIAKLESQISMSQHAGDKEWLRTQDASAVAMLMGVSDDKLSRMLETLSKPKNAGDTDQSS